MILRPLTKIIIFCIIFISKNIFPNYVLNNNSSLIDRTIEFVKHKFNGKDVTFIKKIDDTNEGTTEIIVKATINGKENLIEIDYDKNMNIAEVEQEIELHEIPTWIIQKAKTTLPNLYDVEKSRYFQKSMDKDLNLKWYEFEEVKLNNGKVVDIEIDKNGKEIRIVYGDNTSAY